MKLPENPFWDRKLRADKEYQKMKPPEKKPSKIHFGTESLV